MGYDGMGILVCFEWVRGHISKDVKLVLGLLFVLFLLLFTAGQGSACLTVTAKTLSSARPTRICRFFWEDELVPSRLDESWCFRLQHFWLKCMRFAMGIWGCKMVKQAANICKLSKTKTFCTAKSCLYLPSQWTNWNKFFVAPGLLEIRCVPTVLLASKIKFFPTAQAKPYGSWCSWARRRFLGDDGRNDELLEFWDISPPSFLIGKLYVNRIIHKISIYI